MRAREVDLRVTVVPLAEHPECVPLLGQWLARHWFNRMGRNRAQIERALRLRMNVDSLPMAWIAFAGRVPVGTASLQRDRLPSEPGSWKARAPRLTHCLTAVYVLPHWRGRGVGGRLCARALLEARQLGLPQLDLYSVDRTKYYRRRGWQTLGYTLISDGVRWRRAAFMRQEL